MNPKLDKRKEIQTHHTQNAESNNTEKTLKAARGKQSFIYKAATIKLTPDFSLETMKVKAMGQQYFKC